MARRGRPYQIPEDRTPLFSPTVEDSARVGWLLLMSRLHHDDPQFIGGAHFTDLLIGRGLRIDRSLVSRWESGYAVPRPAVLAAYESLLGLPDGQLTSTVAMLRGEYDDQPAKPATTELDPSSVDFHRRLDDLLDILPTGEAGGADWMHFGSHVAASDMLYLHHGIWHELAARLVDELGRSFGLAAVQRYQAARVLIGHRVARPWVVGAVQQWLAEPAAPHSDWLVCLLKSASDTRSTEVLLDRLVDASGMPLDATVAVIAAKVRDGHVDDRQLGRIEALVQHAVHRAPADVGPLGELIEALPTEARSRLEQTYADKLDSPVRATGGWPDELVTGEQARTVTERLAGVLRSRMPAATVYDVDRMTPRIIREALFARGYKLRHCASVTLHASPFRWALAEVVANEIDDCGLEDSATPHLTRLLSYLVTCQQEDRVRTWLHKAPVPAAYHLARAMATLPGRVARPEDLLDTLANDGSRLDTAVIRILGMRQDREIKALSLHPSLSADNRAAAAWWRRHGGAVAN